MQNTRMELQSNCGPGLWYRVAYLNMTDPSQKCPPAWREYNESGKRACGRPIIRRGRCAAKYYLTSNQYSRVCGMVIGYQIKTPDAFGKFGDQQINFDGVNITSREQGDHFWSYVGGQSSGKASNCPCSNGPSPPSIIGNNYRATQPVPFQTIHYGMASSVKAPAAMVPTLPHGSVYSFLFPQLI